VGAWARCVEGTAQAFGKASALKAEHESEDLLVGDNGQTLPDLQQAGVVRCSGEWDSHEGPQRQAVRVPPGDTPLTVEGLEVSDQEHAEVDAGSAGVAADVIGEVGLAEGLDVGVEAGPGRRDDSVVVEGVSGSEPVPAWDPAAHAHDKPRGLWLAG
jgi:hypothetical protein